MFEVGMCDGEFFETVWMMDFVVVELFCGALDFKHGIFWFCFYYSSLLKWVFKIEPQFFL